MNKPVPKWFRVSIATGLNQLQLLSLRSTPPRDVLTGVAEVWCASLWSERHWSKMLQEDEFRVAEEVSHLKNVRQFWPVPRQLLREMPDRPKQDTSGEMTAESRAAVQWLLDQAKTRAIQELTNERISKKTS